MNKNLLCLLLTFSSYFAVSNAIAEPVSFEVSATVYYVGDLGNALGGSVSPGDTINGTYTIDITTTDNNPSPEYGHYPHNLSESNTSSIGFDLNLNNHHLKSNHANPNHMFEAFVMNSISDHFYVGSWGNNPLTNGTRVDDIIIDLYDPTGQALMNDALPAQTLNISAFEAHNLHVFGSSTNNSYYNIDAKIDSISAITSSNQNQCSSNTSPIEKFLVNATVREIWDEGNVITNKINIGDTLSGSYTFNTSTLDSASLPNIGFFEHQNSSGEYGFDLTINNHNIKTGNNSLNIFLIDGQTEADIYSVDTYGSQIPFINGSNVNFISVHINDPSRNLITSATLTSTPPAFSDSEIIREIYISGQSNTPMGSSYFSIIATLNSIENDCTEVQSQIIISPAEGSFDPDQRFDAAIIMEPGLASLVSMQGTLNGMDISPVLSSCFPGAPNIQNRQTFICPDFSNMLMPGNNTLNINFNLSDGSLLQHSVNWQLMGL